MARLQVYPQQNLERSTGSVPRGVAQLGSHQRVMKLHSRPMAIIMQLMVLKLKWRVISEGTSLVPRPVRKIGEFLNGPGDEATSEVTILQLEAGGARRQKKRKVIEREQKIKTLADELANGDRDIDSYISAIRQLVLFPLILANTFLVTLVYVPNNKVY